MNKSAETQKPGSSGLGRLRDSACVCLAVSKLGEKELS